MNIQATASTSTPLSKSGALAALLDAIQGPIGSAKTSTLRLGFDNKTQMLNSRAALRLIKQGISCKVLEPLGEFLSMDRRQVAEYLDMGRTTSASDNVVDQYLPMHSAENVLRLIELAKIASDIFSTEAETLAWMRKPHSMLEGDNPIQAAKTAFGTQDVKDILLAMKYGGAV